jgi:hypothetical protein
VALGGSWTQVDSSSPITTGVPGALGGGNNPSESLGDDLIIGNITASGGAVVRHEVIQQ